MILGNMKIAKFLIFLVALKVCGAHEASHNNASYTPVKAIEDLCHNTNYQETCIKALTNVTNSTDPKIIVKASFKITVERLKNTINKIVTLLNASQDPEAAQAYEICENYLVLAMSDMQEAVGLYDLFVSKPETYPHNIKSRVTGASTYEQTCIDSFEGATKDVRDQMNGLIKEAHELTINGLALLNGF